VRKSVFSSLVFGTLALATSESGALISAVAHEGHKMECTETGINAMNADIQAMPDGEAKTTAMKEMQMAEDMMTKKDTEGCDAHMHNAMQATEK
jgi:hypothetical protein